MTLLVPAHLPQLRTGEPAGLTLMLQAHLFSCQSLHSLLCNCTKENILYLLQSLTPPPPPPPPPPNRGSNKHYGPHTGICEKRKKKEFHFIQLADISYPWADQANIFREHVTACLWRWPYLPSICFTVEFPCNNIFKQLSTCHPAHTPTKIEDMPKYTSNKNHTAGVYSLTYDMTERD